MISDFVNYVGLRTRACQQQICPVLPSVTQHNYPVMSWFSLIIKMSCANFVLFPPPIVKGPRHSIDLDFEFTEEKEELSDKEIMEEENDIDYDFFGTSCLKRRMKCPAELKASLSPAPGLCRHPFLMFLVNPP